MNEVYELEDFEIGIFEENAEDKKEFIIDTDAKADWAINIIKQKKSEYERLEGVIDAEIDALKNKKTKLKEKSNCGFLKGKLNDYFDAIDNKKDTKIQLKYSLPSGDLILKKPTTKLVKDDKVLVQWLLDNDKYDFIKIEHKVDWMAIKKSNFVNEADGIIEEDVEAKFEIK